MSDPRESLYGSSAVVRRTQVSLRQLYHWVGTLEVVTPKMRRYGSRSFQRFSERDIITIREMKRLVDSGYTPRAAAEIVRRDGQSNGRVNG